MTTIYRRKKTKPEDHPLAEPLDNLCIALQIVLNGAVKASQAIKSADADELDHALQLLCEDSYPLIAEEWESIEALLCSCPECGRDNAVVAS